MAVFEFACTLRWGDMDAYGHVNNVTVLEYLQEARVAMIFAGEAATEIPLLAEGVVIASHEVQYRKIIDWRPEPVRIDSWVSQLGAARFTIEYEIHLDISRERHDAAVTAKTVLVPFDLSNGNARRLTAAERSFLSRFER